MVEAVSVRRHRRHTNPTMSTSTIAPASASAMPIDWRSVLPTAAGVAVVGASPAARVASTDAVELLMGCGVAAADEVSAAAV